MQSIRDKKYSKEPAVLVSKAKRDSTRHVYYASWARQKEILRDMSIMRAGNICQLGK